MSQLTTNTETIGKHTYTVGRLDPFIANDILVDVFKIVGPAIGAFGGELASMKPTSATDIEQLIDEAAKTDEGDPQLGAKFASAVERLAKSLDKKMLRDVMTAFANVSTVDYGDGRAPRLGAGGTFVAHFRENFGELYPWLVFCLKHQYEVFSGPASKLIAAAGRVLKRAAELQQ